MKMASLRGLVDRRILIHFRADPDVLQALLPPPFTPRLFCGHGLAGVCLFRLRQLRPAFLPAELGVTSENAVHRIAVEWRQDGLTHTGSYVLGRHTSSRLNRIVGRPLFSGKQQHARIQYLEDLERVELEMQCEDRGMNLELAAHIAPLLPASSLFRSLPEAAHAFERNPHDVVRIWRGEDGHGMDLKACGWRSLPLAIERIGVSFFDDHERFPTGSCEFDSALLLRGLVHDSQARECRQAETALGLVPMGVFSTPTPAESVA